MTLFLSGIYSFDLETKKTEKVVIENLPDIRFIPHGLFYSDKFAETLYVVNHGMDVPAVLMRDIDPDGVVCLDLKKV